MACKWDTNSVRHSISTATTTTKITKITTAIAGIVFSLPIVIKKVATIPAAIATSTTTAATSTTQHQQQQQRE